MNTKKIKRRSLSEWFVGALVVSGLLGAYVVGIADSASINDRVNAYTDSVGEFFAPSAKEAPLPPTYEDPTTLVAADKNQASPSVDAAQTSI